MLSPVVDLAVSQGEDYLKNIKIFTFDTANPVFP